MATSAPRSRPTQPVRWSVLIAGWQGCWFGYIRSHQQGTAVLIANHTASFDSTEIVTNQIRGSLALTPTRPPRRSVTPGAFQTT